MAAGSPHQGSLSFVLAGDPNNPDGGLLERFTGFYIPFLDVHFNGATPPNSPYPTAIYTAQYDGIADAPQYPLNVVSDLNAFLGYFFVHSNYPFLTPNQVASAVPLPTSPGYTGNTHVLHGDDPEPAVDPAHSRHPLCGSPDRGHLPARPAGARRLGLRRLRARRRVMRTFRPRPRCSRSPTCSPSSPTWPRAPCRARSPPWWTSGSSPDCTPATSWYPNTYPYLPSPDPHLHIYLGQPSTTGLSSVEWRPRGHPRS